MPKITSIIIQEKDKNRCNLYLDGEFFSGISVECVLKNRLKVGMDVTHSEIKAVIMEDERAVALNKAIGYVSKSLKTKKQVKDYLFRKGYNDDVVWFCIDKLLEYKYIDDEEYAKRYIESTQCKQGKRMMEFKLMSKGVKRQDVSNAFEQVDTDSHSVALQIAQKHIRNKEKTLENISKTYRYLLSKGFSYEEASWAIDKIKDEN